MSPFITYNHFNYENVCLLPLYGHNFEDIFDFLKKFPHSTVTLSWYGHIFSHHTDTILCSDHMTHYTASPTVTLSMKKKVSPYAYGHTFLVWPMSDFVLVYLIFLRIINYVHMIYFYFQRRLFVSNNKNFQRRQVAQIVSFFDKLFFTFRDEQLSLIQKLSATTSRPNS